MGKLSLFNIVQDLHEVVFGELSIFYSFKMPVAYRRKKTFIVREMDPRHLKEVTVTHKHRAVDKNRFIKGLNKAIDAEIVNMAKALSKKNKGAQK
jgi:hypothetical protein